jgi:PAS domain S-box-containing protein
MDVHPGPEKRRVSRRITDADPIRKAFHENEDWFHDLVEHSHDLLCVHDLEGRLLSVNPAPARMLGYSVEEMLRIPMREMVPPEFRAKFDEYLNQIKTTGESRGLVAVRTRSGEHRILEYHNTLRTEGVASPIVRGIAHDVTGQMRTEKLLRKAGEELLAKVRQGESTIRELKLFRALVDQSNDAIKVVDMETLRILDVNEKACSDLGYGREELLTLGIFDIDPAATPADAQQIRERLRTSGSAMRETVHRRKDGMTFPVEVSMRRVALDQEYIVTISRDLTERKLAEERLQDIQNRYRAVHDRAPVGICWVDSRTGRLLLVNPKYCEILGRTEEDLLSRNIQSLTLPDDAAANLKQLRQLRAGELQHYKAEKRYVRPDGSIRWAEVEIVAMCATGQEPAWNMGIAQDITERKQSEEKLQEYARVVEGLEEMILVVDRDYRYVIANRAYLNYRGTEAAVVGRTVDEVVDKEVFDREIKLRMDECFQGRVVQYEMTYAFPKTGERDLFVSYFPIEGPAGVDRIAIVLQDVTERKRAEKALRESERAQKLILDHLQVGIILSSVNEERAIYQNPKFLELFGYSIEEFPTVADWWPIAYPDPAYREWVSQEWTRRMAEAAKVQGEIEPMEVTVTCRNRSEKYVRVLAKVIGDRNFITFIDLSERKQAEEALRQNVTQLQQVTEELRLAKEKLAEEKLYLEEAIDTELGFGEIIGRSGSLKEVLAKAAKVAPSDATVLLLGETGTGKELVARAIHHMSSRKENSFIKLNCAAIPSGLLESELFGHEKGAFTGAVTKKVGRLELADGGTLFLDEIGEIPLDLQPKLLRVLQDQEFERLGGVRTLKVNFRLLAATNRDLLENVRQHEFRSDLYYRLNVFPIRIPPLRERREDIRLLIEHFVRKYANRMNKSITSIPAKTMEALMQWAWPGNIRELENFVERSVILTPGSVLQSPLSELHATVDETNGGSATLRDHDRDRIIRVLRECKGQLGGPNGAAARLGLKRTTLQSKLSQLGINPGGYRN